MKNVAGIVVFYNPTSENWGNILTYINAIKKLYIVDNSDKSIANFGENLDALKLETKTIISYLPNQGNRGIASALNIGCQKAINDGFDFVLTMDQDSRFDDLSIFQFLDLASSQLATDFGVFSPYQNKFKAIQEEMEFSEVKTTMTSGNILSLRAYQKIGRFRESFFIDYVDHEYCLRLRKNKYKIIQCNRILLNHQLGDSRVVKFLTREIAVSNHSPLRRYYITRNRFALISDYFFFDPNFCVHEIYIQMKEIIKIILVERQKLRKIKYSLIGFIDFLASKSGKFNA